MGHGRHHGIRSGVHGLSVLLGRGSRSGMVRGLRRSRALWAVPATGGVGIATVGALGQSGGATVEDGFEVTTL